MGRRWWPLWGLLGAILALLRVCEGSPSHSMQYFYTGVSEPGQGLPRFIAVGYVDRQLFVQYDSNTREMLPRVPWMTEVVREDPKYLDRNTQNFQGSELVFRDSINIVRNRYNQTGGLHTWQWMYGCELRGDGSKGGYYQYGYDGRNFVALDKETLTWTAADAQAQVTKRKWDALGARNQYVKSYLEEICIEWLQKYLRYGNETLLRKEPPKIKVTSRADHDNMETLICRADGFYPKDIHPVWIKDGEVWEQETMRGLMAPNADGTFHTWIGIKIDPKDRDRFQCRVDHAGLEKPVDFAVEEPASSSNFGIIIGGIVGAVILLGIVVALLVFFTHEEEEEEEEELAVPSAEAEAEEEEEQQSSTVPPRKKRRRSSSVILEKLDKVLDTLQSLETQMQSVTARLDFLEAESKLQKQFRIRVARKLGLTAAGASGGEGEPPAAGSDPDAPPAVTQRRRRQVRRKKPAAAAAASTPSSPSPASTSQNL